MKVIVTGSLGFDYIMNFPGRFSDRIMADRIHSLSLSFLVDKLNKQFGGTAGNISYSLKLLGVEPVLLSVAGNDFSAYRKFLADHKIGLTNVDIRKNVSTSSYFVITDKDHNQIGSFFVGATGYADKLSVAKTAKKYRLTSKNSLVILAPTDPAAMKKYVRECRELGLKYIYDPAFQIATFSDQELRDGITGAEILIGNDYEIALIQDKLGMSHEELIMTVPVLVTTLGAKGSAIETRHEIIGVPPVKNVEIVDPTGAGDAYRSGFIAGLVRGYDYSVCGRMGSVAAAYTVELYGTVTHEYSAREFIKRYRDAYGEDLKL